MARAGFSCVACNFSTREQRSLDNHYAASAQCRARQAGSAKGLVCRACSTARRQVRFPSLWKLVQHFESGKCHVIHQKEFWRLVQKLLILDRMEQPENTSRPCITFCTNDLYILQDQHQSSMESNKPEDRLCEDWSLLRTPYMAVPLGLKNISVQNPYGFSERTLKCISISKGYPWDGDSVTERFETPIPTIESAADLWADSSPMHTKRKRGFSWSDSNSEEPAPRPRKPAPPTRTVDTYYLPEGVWDAFRIDKHFDRDTNTYRCGRATCTKRFSDPDAFRAHYISYHAPYDQYKCPANHGPLRKPTLWQLVQHVETNNDKANCGSRYRSWYGKWVSAVTGGFADVAPRAKVSDEPVYVSKDPRGIVLHKPEKVFRRADAKKDVKW